MIKELLQFAKDDVSRVEFVSQHELLYKEYTICFKNACGIDLMWGDIKLEEANDKESATLFQEVTKLKIAAIRKDHLSKIKEDIECGMFSFKIGQYEYELDVRNILEIGEIEYYQCNRDKDTHFDITWKDFEKQSIYAPNRCGDNESHLLEQRRKQLTELKNKWDEYNENK